MFPGRALLTALLLAVTVANASPIVEIREPLVTLPMVRRISEQGIKNILASDQARAKSLITKGRDVAHARSQGLAPPKDKKRAVISVAATNQEVTYVIPVGVGSPATSYSLLIDTGSSNTWVGADKRYVKTSTSKDTGHKVSVSYGSGSFSGEEYTDTVSLGNGLTITSQSIGVASSATGFDGVDGILGIGPVDLTQGTVSGVSSVPTVTDNLFKQGTISSDVIGISFAPPTGENQNNGELTFGGTDSSKYTGSITYATTSTSPADEYWGINQSITYGTTSILSSTAGIVDTGTTLILIATNAFTKYKSATGGVADSTTGLLKITSSQYSALKTLNFVIGGTTFGLTPNAQIFPRSLNADIGGSASSIYLIVADLGSNSGEGLDFINGYSFLERFYSVYDTTNDRVGIANTPNTAATSN